VKEYIDSANLQPSLSDASRRFNEGLRWYFEGYYKKAIQKFERVLKLNDGYPQVNAYMRAARKKINNGEDKQVQVVRYFLFGLAVFLLAGAIYLRYRKK
jgi:hypothetical protein